MFRVAFRVGHGLPNINLIRGTNKNRGKQFKQVIAYKSHQIFTNSNMLSAEYSNAGHKKMLASVKKTSEMQYDPPNRRIRHRRIPKICSPTQVNTL